MMTSKERRLVEQALELLCCWWQCEVGSVAGAAHVIRARELLRRALVLDKTSRDTIVAEVEAAHRVHEAWESEQVKMTAKNPVVAIDILRGHDTTTITVHRKKSVRTHFEPSFPSRDRIENLLSHPDVKDYEFYIGVTYLSVRADVTPLQGRMLSEE